MNKRIKFKKGILQKRCSVKCVKYQAIKDLSLRTNNCCGGCFYRNSVLMDILLDENIAANSKYKRISLRSASKIINTREPRGLFWTKEGKWYIAIDNLTGDAWTQNFETREECFEYLNESVPYHLQCFSPD